MNKCKRNISFLILVLTFFLGSISRVSSQEFRIILDENYTDWKLIPTLYGDNIGDGIDIDFKTVKVTNYDRFLFFYLEIGSEVNLQDQNSITLYLDTDNDASTGLLVKGIGAELEFTFGTRSGKYRDGLQTINISHADISLISIPTVTSPTFEIMLDTAAVIGGKKLFTNSEIKIVVVDKVSGGDEIPNDNGGLSYIFVSTESQQSINYSIDKPNSEWVRILSYNSETDNLFDPSLKDSYSRILKAINPTIIGFQEIYNHTAEQTAELIEEFLPSLESEQWYFSKQGTDIIVVSRFPIDQSFYVEGNGAFLINLRDKYGKDLLLVNAHTPCCDNNDTRQREIDAFMSFIRDAKEEGGVFTVEDKTSIVIVGDMNMVGYSQQQRTLIRGEIVNTNIYGDKFLPDWDSTYLMDAKSPTTHSPSTITWYNTGSSYAPGRLDYIVFSNSVLDLKNSFILFTNELPQDSLDKYNLLFDDVTRASDHLPSVADFDFDPIVSIEETTDAQRPEVFQLHQNYPNPFNPSTAIKYSIPTVKRFAESLNKNDRIGNSLYKVQLKVFDILGRGVETLVKKEQGPGNYEVPFDAKDLTSGIYFYQFIVAGLYSNSGDLFTETKMMLLIK